MNHHQRPHHHSRQISPHDSRPQHSPPHSPTYPYHTPYTSSHSSTPCPHCMAPPTSFHYDRISGDLICTMCGIVLDDHLRDESAEWREFGTVEDMARGNVPGRRARCGEMVVDEARYVGGLMSTTVGREPYNSSSAGGGGAGGNGEERQKLAMLRQRLKRTHNMIENMLEKEQKERYREVVLEEKVRVAKVARGEEQHQQHHEEYNGVTNNSTFKFGETSVRVKGDYEGLMAADQKMQQSSQFNTHSTSLNSKTDERYTTELTNKWSLTHAIILYGTIHHVQQYTGDYHPNTQTNNNHNSDGSSSSSTWTHSTLETERRQLIKKLDTTIVRSSSLYKLYVAFALLEKAATKLGFYGMANATFCEAVKSLIKFACGRDDLKIGGISSSSRKKRGMQCLEEEEGCSSERLVLSLFSNGSGHCEELENLLSSSSTRKKSASKKSSSSYSSTVWNDLHRMKQYASLGAAILYISAKRTGVGRTLVEVCSAFGTFGVVTTNGKSGGDGDGDNVMESLVRPKYCSKAMEELKQVVPDVLAPVQSGVGMATPVSNPPLVPSSVASAASTKQEVVSSSPPPLESIARVTPDYLPSDMSSTIMNNNNTNVEESALTDLTSRMASSLNLPPSAATAAIVVATQCKRDNNNNNSTASSQEGRKPQQPKYIRPRQRKSKKSAMKKNDSDEMIAAASLLLVATAGGIMQRLAEQALSNAQTSMEAQVDTFASWSEWNNQSPWHREVSHLEECTGLPSKSILACYSNNLHSRRAHLLGVVKQKFEQLGDDEGEKCLQNIAVAVPLMSL